MSKAKLFQKISKVMSKVERVPKNGYNSFHKYKFVQESDLVDHVRKFMVEEGLVVYNSVKQYDIKGDIATVEVEIFLCDTETGESISSLFVAEGQDKGDKKFPKAYASATKYFLMKTFLIPTGDDPEYDNGQNTNNSGYNANNAPSYPNNSKRQASGYQNASIPNPNGAPQKEQSKRGQKPDNSDPNQIKYFQKLKGKWELHGGDAKSFSGWYANKQAEGLTNEQIFNNFMEQITSREAKKESV